MFSKDELQVLRAVLGNAEVKGIQAAAVVVSLFHKVDSLINQPEEKPASGGNDVSASPEPNPGQAA